MNGAVATSCKLADGKAVTARLVGAQVIATFDDGTTAGVAVLGGIAGYDARETDDKDSDCVEATRRKRP